MNPNQPIQPPIPNQPVQPPSDGQPLPPPMIAGATAASAYPPVGAPQPIAQGLVPIPAGQAAYPPISAPQPATIATPPLPRTKAELKKARAVANSTQNAVMIAEIRDGIVIMNDGGFRSVIMAQSINFDLMSPEEREAVEYAYQGFLNSLFFDIQIYIRSSRVDIRPYLEKLDKIRMEHENMLLALMMEDYIQFMDVLSQESNIMDKRFYVVVPYHQEVSAQMALKQSKKLFGNLFSAFSQNKAKAVITIDENILEKAKSELKNRVQAVLNGLQQVGIQAVPLDTEELIELYYDSYNPETATRQQIRNIEDLTAPMIEKGEGQAPNPNLNREIQ